MINFNDIGDKQLADIEKPPLLPVGTYRLKVIKVPESTTSANGEWDIVNFNCQIQESVDVDDIGAFPGDIRKQFQRVTFMFNKQDEAEFARSLDRLKTFMTKHLKCADEGDSIKQSLGKAMGSEFLGFVKWRPDKNDAENIFAEIGRTAPLE